MGIFSFFKSRRFEGADAYPVESSTQLASKQIMLALKYAVDELVQQRFSNSDYTANGMMSVLLAPSLSKLSTLSNSRLSLGNGICIPTYNLLGMPLPDHEDGKQYWYGGGWVLERQRGCEQKEIIAINVGNVDGIIKPENVEIEALVKTLAMAKNFGGLESLGRFTLDTLQEITGHSVVTAITQKYLPMFPTVTAG